MAARDPGLVAGVGVMRANAQEGCVMHGFPGHDTVVEASGHIGHGAVLHSCVVRHDAMVGMNAVVMEDAQIGEQAIVAACAFVPAGMRVPPRTLAAGLPAKIKRELQAEEMAWKLDGTRTYQDLTRRCLRSLREVQPLPTVEADCASVQAPIVQPLISLKRSNPDLTTPKR